MFLPHCQDLLFLRAVHLVSDSCCCGSPDHTLCLLAQMDGTSECQRCVCFYITDNIKSQEDLRAAFQYQKGPTRKLERGFLQGQAGIGQGEWLPEFETESRFRLDILGSSSL